MYRRRTLFLPVGRWIAPSLGCVVALMALCGPRAIARAGTLDYRLKLQVAAEVDTNAERKEGNERKTDGATRFLARGSVTWRPAEHHVLQTRIDVGAKVFFRLNDEDLLVTSANLAYSFSAADWLSLGVDGGLKDRHERSSETDYLQSSGGGSMRLVLSRYFDLRVRAGYQRFEFRPDDMSFGYKGDDYSLELTAFPARRMRLSASYSIGRRGYRAPVFVANPTAPQGFSVGSEQRDDQVHSADLRWRLLRKVLVETSYAYQLVRSNSYGFSYARHRVAAQVSSRLPFGFFGHLAGALQFLSFRDPVFIDPVLFIEDDNRNWVAVKLSRELGKGFSMELRYAFFASGFSGDALYYRRHVAALGFAYAL